MALEAQKTPVSEVDPFCREFFEDPFPAHEELRAAGPVVRLSRYDVWAVARYAEVHRVLNDWETFCSSRGVGLTDFAKEKPWRPKSLVLETDPPLHDTTRRVLNRVLSASAMTRLRERFAQEADALIDELVERGSFDAIADLAEAYPLTVFPDAMGMPRENRHFLLPYGNMVFNSFGPRNEFFEAAVADAAPVLAWLQRQMQRDAFAAGRLWGGDPRRKRHRRADARGSADRRSVATDRRRRHDGQRHWRRGLLPRAVPRSSSTGCAPIRHWRAPAFEEAVRYETPVQTFFRTTTRPVELGGIAVGEGEKVLMFLGAANRDPRHWERPDDYDITRRTVGHVGFGSGIHQCVGQLLARLEGECVLSALARKAGSIEITGPPRRRYNNTLRALASLPVTVRPM